MKQLRTIYGTLNEVGNVTIHPNGSIKDCVINERVEWNTPYGTLVPQYEFTSHRNKTGYSASFYENGVLRKISLNHITEIVSPIGLMTAELITFYDSGKIKRVFPLNGQLSAYWEESDEYQLAKELSLTFPFGEVKAKIIAISFYENGAIKDFTLWPREVIKMATPLGEIAVRIGVSFYSNQSIKSIEPAYRKIIKTPIGDLKAYDSNANGISGDKNSLNFTQDGSLSSLITSDNKVTVVNDMGLACTYSPKQTTDMDGIEVTFQPLKISFRENNAIFNDSMAYDLNSYQFIIEPYVRTARSLCSDCASCGQNCSSHSFN